MVRNDSAQDELRRELRRIVDRLAAELTAQRQGGRAVAGDMLRGLAIDEGEAEQLVAALGADLARPIEKPRTTPPAPAIAPPSRDRNETPLARATRVFRLGAVERDALVLALAVELDQRFARLVAYLNDHISRTRPTVGLAIAVADAAMDAVALCRLPALRQGLLLLEGDGPLSSRALRVAPELLPRLAGVAAGDGLPHGVRLRAAEGLSLDELVVEPAQRQVLRHWALSLRAGPPFSPLVLAGAVGSGRATAAQAAAAGAGRALVEFAWAAEPGDRADRLAVAGRETLWHDAILLVRFTEAARDTDLPELWSLLGVWNVPVALAVPQALIEVACAAAPTEPAVVSPGGSSIEQRERLWRQLLSGRGAAMSEGELRELAARYDFLPGTLARAVRRAAAERDFLGADKMLDFAALARSCREVGIAGIGPIAQRLPQPYTREDLVLPPELHAELDLAAAWMRNRRRVFEDWGFGRRIILGQGLTALFAGEPGTGKTMAAQVLARELGLELFRVDLSRVMSKYIGETEKNLSQLFDNARVSGGMLFFDEADVLFSKRSEVKDAHDRYANLEVGYLLQRMEEHTGTTVLATNRLGDLDEAFTRRFHFILDFPMPNARDRGRIWQGMLPRDAEREAELDLDLLARDYEVSGGEIRNAVLSAAFMAADQGRPIGPGHLKLGLRRELLKTGRVLDVRQRRALDGD